VGREGAHLLPLFEHGLGIAGAAAVEGLEARGGGGEGARESRRATGCGQGPGAREGPEGACRRKHGLGGRVEGGGGAAECVVAETRRATSDDDDDDGEVERPPALSLLTPHRVLQPHAGQLGVSTPDPRPLEDVHPLPASLSSSRSSLPAFTRSPRLSCAPSGGIGSSPAAHAHAELRRRPYQARWYPPRATPTSLRAIPRHRRKCSTRRTAAAPCFDYLHARPHVKELRLDLRSLLPASGAQRAMLSPPLLVFVSTSRPAQSLACFLRSSTAAEASEASDERISQRCPATSVAELSILSCTSRFEACVRPRAAHDGVVCSKSLQ